jgi:MarR family transcriptional regulator, organic hydroperoxide resistance regulator
MTRKKASPGQEAFELSFHIFREHRAYMRSLLDPMDLTPMQMHALRALTPSQPTPMATLAGQIFCDPPNLTPIVKHLSQRGLISVSPDPADRRIKRVSLTRQGAELRRDILRALEQPPPLIAGLSQADQRRLRDLFQRMVALLDD